MSFIFHFAIVLMFVLFDTGSAAADDDDNITEIPLMIDGHRAIELDEQTRNMAGIQTVGAESRLYRPEFVAYGRVLDITPLINLRLQYMTSKVRQDSAAEKNRLSRAGMTRLEELHRDEAVSTRQLQEQLAQWQTDRALADEAVLQHRMSIVSSLQHWGNTLTEWFTQMPSSEADDIIHHNKQLLQITLPTLSVLPAEVNRIRVSADGNKKNAIPARLVEAAPQVDPVFQGRQYFFLTNNTNLPTGLQVTTWIPSQKESIDGVIIPRSALLWRLGQAFVFIERKNGQFIRRDIDNYLDVDAGYFVSTAIQAGESVVSSGAQTLLSQQLREQIPDEDDED